MQAQGDELRAHGEGRGRVGRRGEELARQGGQGKCRAWRRSTQRRDARLDGRQAAAAGPYPHVLRSHFTCYAGGYLGYSARAAIEAEAEAAAVAEEAARPEPVVKADGTLPSGEGPNRHADPARRSPTARRNFTSVHRCRSTTLKQEGELSGNIELRRFSRTSPKVRSQVEARVITGWRRVLSHRAACRAVQRRLLIGRKECYSGRDFTRPIPTGSAMPRQILTYARLPYRRAFGSANDRPGRGHLKSIATLRPDRSQWFAPIVLGVAAPALQIRRRRFFFTHNRNMARLRSGPACPQSGSCVREGQRHALG